MLGNPYVTLFIGAAGVCAGLHLMLTSTYTLGHDNACKLFTHIIKKEKEALSKIMEPEIIPEDTESDVTVIKEGKKEIEQD